MDELSDNSTDEPGPRDLFVPGFCEPARYLGNKGAFLRGILRPALIMAAIFCVTGPAIADTQSCGTLILPSGIGIGTGDDITNFNPLLTDSLYNQEAADLMFQPLIWINGATLRIDWSRSIASAVTSPDNGTTYDVKMRPWVWSAGAAVTSADVAYTWGLIKAFGATYSGYGAGGMPDIVKQLTIVSPEEFQVVLKHKVNRQWFILNGLVQLLPLPMHAWKNFTPDQVFEHQSDVAFFHVVDGPLRPAALNIGQDLVFVPNPKWPFARLHFDRLIFKFVHSDGQTVEQFEDGELDLINVPFGLWNAVQHLPHSHTVILPTPLDYNDIVLNFRNPKVAFFRDVRVRQAMEDAIDQKQMIQLVDHGLGEAHWGPMPVFPPTFLTPQMRAGHYPVGYDPAHALALLKNAGYARGADGIMQKHGQRLSFTYLDTVGSGLEAQITLLTQSYLRQIGIEMNVREMEFNQVLALLNNPHADWEATGLGASISAYPTGEVSFKTGSFENSGGYSDLTMDKLIDESTTESGLQGLYAYETYASAQQPVIFMEREGVAILAQNRIKGAAHFTDQLYNYYPEALSCPAPAQNAAR
jgi:peptide/nickel transport system substrate-binding protein